MRSRGARLAVLGGSLAVLAGVAVTGNVWLIVAAATLVVTVSAVSLRHPPEG